MKEENSIYSRKFLKQNWEELIKIGFPIAIIENERRWGYFIEHFEYPEIPFHLQDLSTESMTMLYHLICKGSDNMSLKEYIEIMIS